MKEAAEHVDRNLHAYTAALSTGSSIPALVYYLMVTVASPHGFSLIAKWIHLFEVSFVLRCIQHLSLSAWLPGGTLPDNP